MRVCHLCHAVRCVCDHVVCVSVFVFMLSVEVSRPTLKLFRGKLSNFNWVRTSGYFGEPLVQMTTPHVARNCLYNCPPSEN